MFWEFFIPVVSFLGLIIGIILSKISPEEMKSGKKYFQIFEKIILLALVLVLINSSFIWWLIPAGIVFGYLFPLRYLYLGFALVSTWTSNLFLTSSLIFIHGLPYGSLLRSKKEVLVSLTFFLPFLLFFWKTEFQITSFIAGLLFVQIFKKK